MTHRFDLEQNIMQCWNVCDDIQLYLDMHDNMDEDQRMNYLIGLKQMYQMKFERLWDNFEVCIRNKQI
jgi:hypothetical protein